MKACEAVPAVGIPQRLPASRLDVTLTYNIHRSFTDKWDGSPSISERDNDMYSYFSLGILYRLGEHNYNNEWTSPIDQLTDDVSVLSINIDEERHAIKAYTDILRGISPENAILYNVIQDILRDEQQHLEELQNLQL